MAKTDDDDDLQDEELPPAPQTSLLTVLLCVLNVAAVLAFAYLLLMNLTTRQRWERMGFLHDLAIQGLPLEEDADGPSSAYALAEPMTLEPDWLKEAYQKRGAKPVQDKFRRAELELQPIRPQNLSDDLLKELFQKHGQNPVATLDDEMKRVKDKLPGWLDDAAKAASEKGKGEQKRQILLYTYLLPLTHLVDKTDQPLLLAQAVQNANAAQLDDLLADAAKRKLLVDLLSRLELFRPYDTAEAGKLLRAASLVDPPKGQVLALSKDAYQVKTEELTEQLLKRVAEATAAKNWKGDERTDLEKRRAVAFVLFNLSRTPGADGKTPLYPPGRAEIVSGVREHTQAAETTALVLDRLQGQIMHAIHLNRGPEFVYDLGYRIHDPKLFAEKLTDLLVVMKVFPARDDKDNADAAKKRDAFEKAAQDLFATQVGKLRTDDKETAAEKALKKVKELLTNQGVVITEDKEDVAKKRKVREAQFDREVLRLVDSRETGFVGAHHDLVEQIRDLEARIRQMDNRFKELEAQEQQVQAELKLRQEHVAGVAKKVAAARDQSLRASQDLAALEQQRFRAQLELANADRINRIYERYLRKLEALPKYKRKGLR